MNLVQEFGLGILDQPAERVLGYRVILIARSEKTRNDKRGPSAESALADQVRRLRRNR